MKRLWLLGAVLTTACVRMGVPDGTVAVEQTAAGNQLVEIEMVRMPPPEDYQDDFGREARTFAVWLVRDGVALRAGDLDYDYGSAVARGSVVTPYPNFRVMVTADPLGTEQPGDQVVFEQDVAS